jgi:ABC-type amino acid transport system permease subunit
MHFEEILTGTGITVVFTLGSYTFGFLGGLLICTAMKIKPKSLRILNMFCDIFRGTPIILQALIFQKLLSGLITSNMLLAILIFGCNSMAYSSQIMLSAINGIPDSQYEAGLSLGLTPLRCYRQVILPQAVRNAIPALLNEFNSLLKEGAIVEIIALGDLFSVVDRLGAETGKELQFYTIAGCIYLTIALSVKRIVNLWPKDKR